MVIRDEVREAQRALTALDAAHSRAVARLDETVARRAQVLAEADRQVSDARAGVDVAIAGMALKVGVDLAATVLGVEVAEVRRLAKSYPTVAAKTNGTAK